MKKFSFFNLKSEKEYTMLQEIMEQKDVFKTLCNKYFDENFNINADDFPLKKWDRVLICASGTSKHAGEIAKYVIESIAKLPCGVEFASEYAHKDVVLGKNDLFVAISQSGNTADTFVALTKAKEIGAKTLAITNDVTSKIHTNADFKILADAGVEKSIAATKSFTAQLLILYVFAMAYAEKVQGLDIFEFKKEFVSLAEKYDEVYAQRDIIKKIAKKMKKAKSIAVLGRNINSALAIEGSLKIKETCYINAVAVPAGEFMHGHFAFIDKKVPIIALLNKNEDIENYNLMLHNLCEVKAKRKANIILLKTQGDDAVVEKVQNKHCIDIPHANKWLAPFLNLVALQLLAFETANLLHDDVDQPRDLIKCVANE